MFVIELLIALVFAFALSLLMVAAFGWEYPNRPGLFPSFLLLFLLLLVIIWAGGLWVQPFGPMVYGVPWLGFLLIGIVAALLIAALIPPRRKTAETPPGPPTSTTGAALSLFFWILIIFLIILIIANYI